MADNVTVVRSGGVSFLGLLALLFIALKLCGVIAWSWWWVLAPLWVGLAVVLAVFLFGLACLLIAGVLTAIAKIVD